MHQKFRKETNIYMSEIVLAVVIVALIGFIAYEKYEMRKERNKYINALLSKDAVQLRDLEFVDKIKLPKEEPKDNLVAAEEMTDQEFTEHIREAVNN